MFCAKKRLIAYILILTALLVSASRKAHSASSAQLECLLTEITDAVNSSDSENLDPLQNKEVLKLGKKQIETLIRIQQSRFKDLPKEGLGIPREKVRRMIELSSKFLRDNAESSFTKENLRHVMEHVIRIEKHQDAIHEFLGIDYLDSILLAVAHDLGKAKPPEAAKAYLQSLFPNLPSSFIAHTIMPHEYYSMIWIAKLGKEAGLSRNQIFTLLDQISNHNFGPNLKTAEGWNQFKNKWWAKQWNIFANYLNKETDIRPVINKRYGSPETALATLLTFYDRVTGSTIDAFHKYLASDLLSGRAFSSENIIDKLRTDIPSIKSEIDAMGEMLTQFFTPAGKEKGLDQFPPYQDAHRGLEITQNWMEKMIADNTDARFRELNLDPQLKKNSILYFDQQENATLISAPSSGAAPSEISIFIKNSRGQWIKQSSRQSNSPLSELMETVYKDLNLKYSSGRLPLGFVASKEPATIDGVKIGFTLQEVKNLSQFAKDKGYNLYFRLPNPESLKFLENPNAKPKPFSIPLKTAETGPNAGKVVKPTRSDFNSIAEHRGAEKLWNLFKKTDYFKENLRVNKDGVIIDRESGAFFISDRDIYLVEDKNNKPIPMDDTTEGQANRKELNRVLALYGSYPANFEPIQHGSAIQWRHYYKIHNNAERLLMITEEGKAKLLRVLDFSFRNSKKH